MDIPLTTHSICGSIVIIGVFMVWIYRYPIHINIKIDEIDWINNQIIKTCFRKIKPVLKVKTG